MRASHRRNTSPRSWAKRGLAALAVAIVAGTAAIVAPLVAHADFVSISGIAVGPANTPLVGVTVSAVRVDGNSQGDVQAQTITGLGGAFYFHDLDTGASTSQAYTLKFDASTTTYAQYLGGNSYYSEAQQVTLQEEFGGAFLRAALQPSGSISGKVSGPAGVVSGGTVRAYSRTSDGFWVVARSAVTASTGLYALTGLEPGKYRLEASGPALSAFAPVFSGGGSAVATASDVLVRESASTAADFALGASGTVSGVVTAGDTLTPMAGVIVTPVQLIGPPAALVDYRELTPRITTPTGAFTITGLPAGNYTLKFTPPNTNFAQAYLGGGGSRFEATRFAVTAGGVITGKDFHLTGGASIAGYTETETLDPSPGVRVTLDSFDDYPLDGAHTPRSVVSDPVTGEFEFDGLAPGTYLLTTGEITDGHARFLSFDNITVTEGQQLSGRIALVIDMPPGGLAPLNDPQLTNTGTYVGAHAHVTAGDWNDDVSANRTITYQWVRDGVPIPGATSHDYTFSPADFGAVLTARVHMLSDAYGAATFTTPPVGPITVGAAATVGAAGPSVGGLGKVGEPVVANEGEWQVLGVNGTVPSDPGFAWSYQWQAGDGVSSWTNVTGSDSTSRTHIVGPTDYDHGFVRVVLHGVRSGYPNVDVATAAIPISVGTFAPLVAPKVTKTGTTAKLSLGTWKPTPAAGDFHVTWTAYNRDGSPASTQTGGTTYSLAGKAGVFVTVTIVVDNGAGHIQGAPVVLTVQTGSGITGSGPNAITPSAAVEQTLTAPATVWNATGVSVGYQWQYLKGAVWTKIAGATAVTFTPPASLVAKKLRVVETATKPGYAVGSRTSTVAVIGLGAAPAPTLPPSIISGSVTINSKFTIDPGVWPSGSSFAYVWKYGGAGGPYTTLTAAVSHVVIPAAAEGSHLFLDLKVMLPGHMSATYPVDWGVVTGGVLAPTVAPKQTSTSCTGYNVSAGTWSPSPASVVANWYIVNDSGALVLQTSLNPGTPAPNYCLVKHPVVVQVVAHASGYTDGVAEILASKGTFAAQTLTIDTSAGGRVDSAFGVTEPSDYGPDTVTRSYQWQYLKTAPSTWANIPGAVGATFTPTGITYLGKSVRALVTVAADRYTSATFASTSAVVAIGLAPTPNFGGNGPVFNPPGGNFGQPMTVTPGAWSGSPTSFTYQWQSSVDAVTYTNITGATTSTFTPPAVLYNNHLRVLITSVWAAHLPGTIAAEGVIVGPGFSTVTTPPVVTRAGDTLTVSNGVSSPASTHVDYQWLGIDNVTGAQSSLSTTNSYTLQPSDVGDRIRVIVSGSRLPDYLPSGFAVEVQEGTLNYGPLSVTGSNAVGVTLTASTGAVTLGTALAWQWLRNGAAIAGATSSTYVQALADVGQNISVRLTMTKLHFTTVASVIYAPGVPITNAVKPVVSPAGAAAVGVALSATTGVWSASGLSFAYSWQRNGVAIPGATSATYTPVTADAGGELAVEVTASRPGAVPVAARSASHPVQIGAAPTFTELAAFSNGSLLVGPRTVDQYLGVPQVTWSGPVSVSYQWQSYSTASSTWSDIVGAVANRFHPDAPGSVRVIMTATWPGHASATFTSGGVLIAP